MGSKFVSSRIAGVDAEGQPMDVWTGAVAARTTAEQTAFDTESAGRVPPVPVSVPKLWLKYALEDVTVGTPPDDVTGWAAMTAHLATLSASVQEDWALAAEIGRAHPQVAAAATALGWSDADVDAIFRSARSLGLAAG